jgi:acyl carrier protein
MQNKYLSLIKEVLEIEGREITFNDVFRDFDEWDSLSRLSLIAMLDDEYEVGKAFEIGR